ncbi:CehA/McbA family metallohydrolase [Halorhabdus sp. CUG00001]|uniref:CehA/McbA family metallohydrolase n=1 Tax=Halorhabdus sp. CUG00001 TaxID=2600297 RepID=UPI00351AF121
MTTFANALTERGFDVTTKQAGSGEGLTTTDLSKYDIVVIPVPQRPYTDAELEKIHEYVENGGSLFAVGQWTDPFRGKVADMNAVVEPYGLQFNGETNTSLRNIQDPTNTTVEGYDWRILLHNTVDHPITQGVDTVEYDGVSLNVSDDGMGTRSPLLYGDEDTYEFTYSTTEERFERGKEIVGAAAAWDIGQNGRVVAFGSQKTLTSYIKESWQEEHVQTDSRRFAMRTVKWLATSGHLEKPEKPVAERGLAVKGGETSTNESVVLRNEEVAFTIGTETNGPFGALPGGIYDGAAYGMSTDRIGVSEFAANDFGAWAVYESFELTNASGPNGAAVVTAKGYVKENPDVSITTEYVLEAGAKHVWINTTMENTGDMRYPANESEQLLSGLALSSEGLSAWMPGIGDNSEGRYNLSGNPALTEPWAALSGDRVTYGVWGASGSFDVYTASTTWVDPWLQHSLDAGETTQVDYAFYVGAHGGTSQLSEYYAEQHGTDLGTVSGTIETTKDEAVPKAEVVVNHDGDAYTYTVGSQDGEYSLKLPAGEYTLQADAEGFAASDSKTVSVTAGETSNVRFSSLEGPAPVNVTAMLEHDGTTEPTDARITVKSESGSTLRTVYTKPIPVGQQSFQLPPGNYTLVFNHGTNYVAEPVTKNITVQPGNPVNVTATITEELDPSERDWIGVEPHAHSGVSFDGRTPTNMFMAVQLSSGVDMAFISDHNAIGAWGTLSSQAEQRGLQLIRSEEITTGDLGHFNPYPMHGENMIDSEGTLVEFIQESREQHNATVFQINHPGDRFVDLSGAPGQHMQYLEMIDAIEAYNGIYDPEDANSVKGLFNLWNKGYDHIAATGVSDDHNWKAFPTKYGTARTHAYVEGDVTPEKWAQAVKDGHTYATYGPAVEFAVEGEIPGATITATAGSSVEASATVRNLDELAYAHVIRNGSVVANVTLDGTEDTISQQVAIEGESDAWISLRVVDTEGDRALTSPVWVDVEAAETPTETATETPTETATETPTETATETPTETTTKTDTETTTTSGPGFTAAIALVALLGAALLALRRRT